MKECSKSIMRRMHEPNFSNRYFVGNGLDVGGGPDPLGLYVELFPRMQGVKVWDKEDGDAETLDGIEDGQFDFVHSSHCLEHLEDPLAGLQNWFRAVKPGGHLIVTVPDEDMEIIESMPVKSLITFPQSGVEVNLGDSLKLNGHAWAGDYEVASLSLSNDFGQTWVEADLKKPVNRLAWQQWSGDVSFPKKGYYEVWARAVDSEGVSQPMLIPGWNPKGYLNNSCYRIAVYVV